MNQASVWVLLAAVLVGFSAAWLVFEVRRAWSPEALHVEEGSVSTVDTEALTHLMPALVEQVTQLRREIAAVRAAELEAALRARLDLRTEPASPTSRVEEPRVEEPTAEEPTAEEPTAEEPAERPSAEEPTPDDDWPDDGPCYESRDLASTISFRSIAAWGQRS